jgi:hypothetical protein
VVEYDKAWQQANEEAGRRAIKRLTTSISYLSTRAEQSLFGVLLADRGLLPHLLAYPRHLGFGVVAMMRIERIDGCLCLQAALSYLVAGSLQMSEQLLQAVFQAEVREQVERPWRGEASPNSRCQVRESSQEAWTFSYSEIGVACSRKLQ